MSLLNALLNSALGWIDVAQNRDKWQALANTEINLSVSENRRNFLTS